MRGMVDIKFKEVCYTCPHRDTYMEDETFYGDDYPFAVMTRIGCKHEKVCKLYLESED